MQVLPLILGCSSLYISIMQITVQLVEGCLGHHWWRYIHTPTKRCHCSITLTILTKSSKCPFLNQNHFFPKNWNPYCIPLRNNTFGCTHSHYNKFHCASYILSEIKLASTCSLSILPIQAGQRPIIVIKDKNNSLLIIKLRSGTVAGGRVTGGVQSSVDFNETFSFCAEATAVQIN